MTSTDGDQQLRDLALSAIPSAWGGLDRDGRDDVIDLLAAYDHVLALKYLLDSPSLSEELATRIRNELSTHAA